MKIAKLPIYFSIAFLGLWCFIGLFPNLISSDKPLYLNKDGQISFPISEPNTYLDYKDFEDQNAIWPLIPFSPSELDIQNTGSSAPGALEVRKAGNFKHILGTDHLGRDVAAGIISGANVSLKIVFYSLLLASGLGIFLGLVTGFFGDRGLKMQRSQLVLIVGLVLILVFHSIGNIQFFSFSLLFWTLICLISYFILNKIPIPFFKGKSNIALDFIISRFLEIFDSIPKILLLIAIFAGFSPSIERVIILIALISWPGITKIVRAETLIEKNKTYIQAGKALGFRNSRLLFIHILPNIIAPIAVFLTFNAGAIILIESSLSFLGLGMPPDVLTWGRMLALAKNQISAWWLVFFAGFFIFATVFSLNTVGRYLSSKFQYRKRQQLLI